jgi:hypothetical protein
VLGPAADVPVSELAPVFLLAVDQRLARAPQESRHGHLLPNSALEVIFVSSAGVAVVGFAIWFFRFAGASPVPLNIGF